MEFRNPALRKGLESSQMLDNDQVCTKFGIFGKTIILILIAIFTGMIATVLLHRGILKDSDEALGALVILTIISAILSLVSGIVACLSVRLCKIFSVIYAAAEGVLLGTVTAFADLAYPGIGITALVITFGVTLGMGVLYFTGIVKASQKLKTFVLSVLIGVLVISLVALICNLFHVYIVSEFFFGETSIVAWALSILLVIVAALSLVFDFDYAACLVEEGADSKYEWTAAHGLLVGVIYLYIRILELLIRIAASRKN